VATLDPTFSVDPKDSVAEFGETGTGEGDVLRVHGSLITRVFVQYGYE
jgi:hypothetical protein